MPAKYVYAFGGGSAEGDGTQKNLLGGKGAGLAEMSRLGIPVPPGFTITTEVCTFYQDHDGSYPETLESEVAEQLERLETQSGQRFGDPRNPLLVSVRSGAARSMPGMMDTILNLGLSEEVVAAWIGRGEDARFVLDAYRRLLTMYGDVVMGVPHSEFERILGNARREQGAANDAELTAESLRKVADAFKGLIAERCGKPFPQKPHDQLWGSIGAVFASWNNPRAREYRKIEKISDLLGTAVNVQTMVFGNQGSDCATGVAFTRNPATGEKKVFGEYLINAQGEDVVAGIRTPKPIVSTDGQAGLGADFPEAHRQLQEICDKLEKHYRDMQDVEFTIQHGKLFMLQTRSGKRTGPAAVRVAVEMVEEGVIDQREALGRVEPSQLAQLLAPELDAGEKQRAIAAGKLLTHGLPAGPGAASGRIALTADRAAEMAASGPVLLVRAETSPEDIVGMHASAGIVTSRGGMTSHAAVVARGLGKPCVVGAGDLDVNEEEGTVKVGDRTFHEGDEMSIDGTTGEVIAGAIATRDSEILRVLLDGVEPSQPSPAARGFAKLLDWADAERRLRIRANADTPHDARVAAALGAQGIGLCRTEHMFFADERIPWVRQMILAENAEIRDAALAKLLPMQQQDFEGIFAALGGLPVTIRLLDPPLHEFLPHEDKALRVLAEQMGIDPAAVKARAEALAEANPMLGLRGCRLGITAPEIYEMQVKAIVRAAAVRAKAGAPVRPEIMVPLVGTEAEIVRLREMIATTVDRILQEEGVRLEILIGTMIEVPRAALVADKIARHADFFSFGTNDLTQMTYGYSRDDAGRFLPQYISSKVLPYDPFQQIDEEGVGQLVRMACERGRETREDLHLGVCGEHGGDPQSIDFFERVGLDYVSCSPYRVPIARLAAARSSLARKARAEEGLKTPKPAPQAATAR
ncbi:MAG TPA: pyruvate, phosphate dikinase, partial [Thermoanaerobaculia bacterium]|nr:pyruvate, phosphate dikinase [Thermoanaerobaculia bacterium]